MKKIIYSLVIMIAAGSLFTSCIEQVEPAGLLDMRTAKAEYIRALKDLRAADAEYTRAKAAVEQANARYRDAETAFKQAQVENQKLLNDLQSLWNEATAQENVRRAAEIAAEIEGIEMKMEELAAEHAIKMVQYEAQLAQAQETLRTVLRDIAIASKSLSPNEKLAVIESAALVAVLSDAQVAALKEVNEAQKELDTLMFQAFKANNVWDEGFLEGAEEHWQEKIEEQQAIIAIAEIAKTLVPLATAQISEWQDIVDGYAKDSIAIAQEIAQQEYDQTAYWNATVKPGIVKFNKAIADFIDENWEEVEGNASILAEPAYTAAQKAWVGKSAPKNEGSKYWAEVGGPSATVALPDLTDIESEVTWNKLTFMLTNAEQSYGQIQNPLYEPDTMILTQIDDTLRFIGEVPADAAMREFIVGDTDGSIGSQKYGKLVADYGLWGAYSILERVYVANKQDLKDTIPFLARMKDNADSAWAAQNAILKAGLAAYEPYQKAIDNFVEAAEIYNAKIVEMNNAINGFVNVWNARYTTGHDWGRDDSTAVVEAIVAFAQARESYLEGWADTVKKHAGLHQNPNYVYYVSGLDPYKVDSLKITELTIDKIREKSELSDYHNFSKYEMMPVYVDLNQYARPKTEYILNSTERDDNYYSSTHHYYSNDHGVFDWIVYNMLGMNAYNVANGSREIDDHSYRAWNQITLENIAAVINGNASERGLFYGWEYIPGTTLTNGKVVNKSTTGQVGFDAVVKAEEAVRASAGAYVNEYNKYWGKNADTTSFSATYADYFNKVINEASASDIATAKKTAEETFATAKFDQNLMTKDKLPADSYNISVFRPYGDQTPLVTFDVAASTAIDPDMYKEATIDQTEAFLAILTAVDPYTLNRSDNEEFAGANIKKSAIFYGGIGANELIPETVPTTAFQALYWQYLYYVATHEDILVQDLVKINDWIKAVDKVFDDNSKKTKTTVPVMKSVQQTLFAYDSLNYVSYQERKPEIEAYAAAKKAFVGTRTEIIDGKDSVVVNDLYIVRGTGDVAGAVDTVTKGSVSFVLTPGMTYSAFEAALFATNVYGDLVGWTKKLDGQQLANAKEAFGEKPYEQIQDWAVARSVNEKKQATLHALKEKAEAVFVEKAKVEGIADPDSTSLASIKAAWNAYVAQLNGVITAANTAIEGYAEKLAEVVGGNIGWDYLIKDAEINLAAAEAKLEDITKMLEKAQSNLDKIMEYIRSTDAEFVIPVTIEEIDALLKSMKTTFDDSYAEIDLQLKALIAAFLSADED